MENPININNRISYARIIKYIFVHLLLLFGVYIVYGLAMHLKISPSPAELLDLDAINYNKIKEGGYSYVENKQSLVAFFPGFPYLWKYSGLGIYGICVLNIVLFLTGFLFLCRYFANDRTEILLFLSLPPMVFMYIPFSEASFFVPSTLLLIGLLKRENWLVMAGLFLCSVFRSASNIFLPAIIVTEMIASNNPSQLKNIFLYTFSMVSGVLLVVWIQYVQTGRWFVFLTTQKQWGVGLRVPSLPFRTWGNMDHLDGAALLAGLVISGIIVYFLVRFVLKGEKRENKAVLFSLLYISGLTIFTIAFKGGAIFSFNRYIVPTAFFFVALTYLIRQRSFTWKQVAAISLLIFVFWIPFFFSFVHILVIIGYLWLTLYLGAYLLLNNKSAMVQKASFYALYAINLVIQVSLFYRITGHFWVG